MANFLAPAYQIPRLLVNIRSKVYRSTEVCVRGDKIADSLAGGTLLLRRLSSDIAWMRATISHSGLGRLSQRRWRKVRGRTTAVATRQLLPYLCEGSRRLDWKLQAADTGESCEEVRFSDSNMSYQIMLVHTCCTLLLVDIAHLKVSYRRQPRFRHWRSGLSRNGMRELRVGWTA